MKEQYLIMVHHGKGWMFVDTPTFETGNEAKYWGWYNYERGNFENPKKFRIINSKDREVFIASYERDQRLKS